MVTATQTAKVQALAKRLNVTPEQVVPFTENDSYVFCVTKEQGETRRYVILTSTHLFDSTVAILNVTACPVDGIGEYLIWKL